MLSVEGKRALCSLVGGHSVQETGVGQDSRAFHYEHVAGLLSLAALDCLEKITFPLLILSTGRAVSKPWSSEWSSSHKVRFGGQRQG